MPQLTRHGSVYELDLGDTQNRFTPDYLSELDHHLTEAHSHEGAKALVTISSGRFFSTGLDLSWMLEHPDRVNELVRAMHRIFARVLTLPMPTTAVVEGHAIGGGAMLALCHDHTIMGAAGRWSLPEVRLPVSFTPGLLSLIRARLRSDVAVEALTTGRPYDQAAAAVAGIAACPGPEQSARDSAHQRASELAALDSATVGEIKGAFHADVVEALRDDSRNVRTASDFAHVAGRDR